MRLGRFGALTGVLVPPVLSSSLAQNSTSNSTSTASSSTTGTYTNQPVGATRAAYIEPVPSSFGGSNGGSYHSPAFLPFGQGLIPQLPQWVTNGASQLGQLNTSRLPPWVSAPLLDGFPWGGRTAGNSDQYTDVPDTGITRYYDFDISYMDISPDGVEKSGIVVNGAFPGPTIEANWGDWIEVTVHNNLPNEGTSIHWHGFLQGNTSWEDGVPAVSQCPIPPATTYVYRFQASLYGSSWYHSHYSAQYAGGLFGPIVVYGPHDNADYDEDLGPVIVSDWYHASYFSLVEQVMAPQSQGLPPPASNNNLINGKMNYPCAQTNRTCTPNAGISKFKFQSGKKYRLRVINTSAEGIQKFSIDGYTFEVIANDFVPIKPYTTDLLTLGVGQRSDIIVTASGKPGDSVWMRSTLGKSALDGGCTLTDGISPEAVAAIYYENANETSVPTTKSNISESRILFCGNDPLTETIPYFAITPDPNPMTIHTINITYGSNGTHELFYMDNSTFRGDYNAPILLSAKMGHDEWEPSYNVYECTGGVSTRIILYNYAPTGAHPMHTHGHNVFVLAEGFGEWDGTVTDPQNPQRRDTQLLQPAQGDGTPAYTVLQFTNDNPGAWPLHCHIAWHVSAGLYVTLLEQQKEIISSASIPSSSAQLCREWGAWTGDHIPDEIDSGL